MDFLQILPLAFVMIAGPQILSAIFLATSENWQRNSAAFLLGAAISVTAFLTIAYLALNGVSEGGASDDTLYVIVLVLLVVAAVRTYEARGVRTPEVDGQAAGVKRPAGVHVWGSCYSGCFRPTSSRRWRLGLTSRDTATR